MPKVKPLTPDEAKKSFANRFSSKADRLRQLATKFGVRPYRVFLTLTRWTGEERGEGEEKIVARRELLPTPRVQSLDAISFNAFRGGTLPVGSLRVDRISASFTSDELAGLFGPLAGQERIPQPYEFFYEVVEDGRGDAHPPRAKFRLLSEPFRRPGKIDWTLMLERISQDRTRDDLSAIGTGREG